MSFIRPLVCQSFFLLALSVSGDSFANFEDGQNEGARWACWYAPSSLSVNCRLSRVPAAGQDMRAAEIKGTIDRRLSGLVRTMWGSPEKLAGASITIPLTTVPYEMDFVKTLAKAVMCSSRKDCSVSFDPNKDGMAPVRVAALEAGASEAEVMAEVILQGMDRANAQVNAESATPRVAKQRRGAVNI